MNCWYWIYELSEHDDHVRLIAFAFLLQEDWFDKSFHNEDDRPMDEYRLKD